MSCPLHIGYIGSAEILRIGIAPALNACPEMDP